MNKKQRNYWLRYFSISQKNFCVGCHKQVYLNQEPKAVVDHKDNDSSHNIAKNLQILCRSCNRIKNPSQKYIPKRILTQSEATNLRAENQWRDWVGSKVLFFGQQGFDVEDAIYAGAELLNVSPETIERRWMRKITSSAGKFIVDNDKIFFKEMHYQNKIKNNTVINLKDYA